MASKKKKKYNKYKGLSISPPVKNEGQQVAVKEMTMNKLQFGEVVFGGNLEYNLNIEANMN